MNDIVIFTIGPVQSYIAAARRTQDLWAGSRLLSDIMKHALDAAPADAVIFPQRDEAGQWPDSLPNRAVVVLPGGQGVDIAGQMAAAARGRWTGIAVAVRDWFAGNVLAPDGQWNWRGIWERQVAHWLEVYWIACPWDDAAESYGEGYGRASRLLDARKLARHFPDHHEYDVKSTLDGAYQALRGQGEGREYAAAAFWERAAAAAPRGDIRRGERLSAIDLIKRFAQDAGQLPAENTRFPSTSSIACADYRLALMKNWNDREGKDGKLIPGTATALTAFVAALDRLVAAFPTRKEQERLRFADSSHEPVPALQRAAAGNPTLFQLGRYDGDTFYPDFYTEARFIEQLGRERSAKLARAELDAVGEAKKALSTLYEAGDALDIPRPALYYAVIALDGDRIGRRLSHPDMTPDVHRQVSRAMDIFTRVKVPEVAGVTYPAPWIYAGGDDALVLAPVSCALEVADALRRTFAETVGVEFDSDEPAPTAGPTTASAGIAIVHQQNPLQAGTRRAKEAEEAAKRLPYGRNALVVHRQTRGGAPQWLGGKWDVAGGLTKLIAELQNHIAAGRLSGKFAYELREEAPALVAVDRSGQEAELKRLLKRHTPDQHRPRVLPQADTLAELSAELGDKGIEQVAEWAVLARFLATGGRRS